jgi:hypothetical protein
MQLQGVCHDAMPWLISFSLDPMQSRIISLLFVLFLLPGCNHWSSSNIAETKARGELIARAVEAYHTKYGSYPGSLTALEPEFLHVIPQPTIAPNKWEYSMFDHRYILAVGNPEVGAYLSRLPGNNWNYMDYQGDLTLR